MKYYHKARGFLYSLQKDSKYFNKHDNTGYKFYSFSNFIPPVPMKKGDLRTLIVSSPDRDFIQWLYGKVSDMSHSSNAINIGEAQFEIESVSFLRTFIDSGSSIITGTPIVMRIPQERYADYEIKSQRPYEYWRPEHDFNAFVKQLSDNLVKKYNQYYNRKIESRNLFEMFKFKKQVCVHRIENGIEIKTIGSLWEFKFNHLEQEQKKILNLGLESGLGELNSSGFGFMNVVK
ncbi:CRISPR-associated endoribonuclease Cas6 [Candidatus Woesearchaeota archaeon]|nr:CRISPR-associated endoribonuclease Cas6 [Candidatus Woesearchaeota archaeon]